MDFISLFQERGFERQEDLGINLAAAGKFFYFYDETYAFDEEGIPWTHRGRVNLSEFLDLEKDPLLWEVAA